MVSSGTPPLIPGLQSDGSRTCAYRRTGTRPCERRASPTRASRRRATCTCKYRQTAPVVWPQKHASPGCAVSPESVLSTGCVDKLPPFGPLSCFPRAGFLSRALGLGNSFGGDFVYPLRSVGFVSLIQTAMRLTSSRTQMQQCAVLDRDPAMNGHA